MSYGKLEPSAIKEGWEISGSPKRITLDHMRKFSGHLGGGENFHTNEKKAKEAGFPAPVAQGMMSYGYILEMIMNAFGERWWRGGELGVSFLRNVLLGDKITAKGIVDSKEVNHSGAQITLQVWCENQRNEKVVAGTATLRVAFE